MEVERISSIRLSFLIKISCLLDKLPPLLACWPARSGSLARQLAPARLLLLLRPPESMIVALLTKQIASSQASKPSKGITQARSKQSKLGKGPQEARRRGGTKKKRGAPLKIATTPPQLPFFFLQKTPCRILIQSAAANSLRMALSLLLLSRALSELFNMQKRTRREGGKKIKRRSKRRSNRTTEGCKIASCWL